MRFVVLGAGGIGGVTGARLAQQGHSVLLIARGAHYEAIIRQRGLQFDAPDGSVRLDLPVVDHPARVEWTDTDVVLIATKSQDTAAALESLAKVAPHTVPVACLQNGVVNERMALRRFPNVYGVCVWCPTAYLSPGVVQAWSAPITGILDIGRYPRGSNELSETLAAVFSASSFDSRTSDDIMRWKYRKLLANLGNAVEALCGQAAQGSRIESEARGEGARCLDAAGLAFVPEEEDGARRHGVVTMRRIEGVKRGGGSTWQSLERRVGSVETDYLNGEIVLLGRLHGVPTPVNTLLQQASWQAAREGRPPGNTRIEELNKILGF